MWKKKTEWTKQTFYGKMAIIHDITERLKKLDLDEINIAEIIGLIMSKAELFFKTRKKIDITRIVKR